MPLGSGRDGQVPGGKRTLLSISLLPREVWMTKSSVSVRPSHSLIRRRASSPAELTFLGERWREGSTGQWSGRFNHKGADSLREYNRFTQYHCDKQNANASHFTSRSNLQTSHLWHVLIYESISLQGRNTDTARYLTVYYRQWERKKWILESFQLDNLIWILIILFIETINQMYTAEYGRGTNVIGLLYKHKHCSNQIQQLQVSSNFSVHTESENTVQLDRSHQIGLSNHILCLKCGCGTDENSLCVQRQYIIWHFWVDNPLNKLFNHITWVMWCF